MPHLPPPPPHARYSQPIHRNDPRGDGRPVPDDDLHLAPDGFRRHNAGRRLCPDDDDDDDDRRWRRRSEQLDRRLRLFSGRPRAADRMRLLHRLSWESVGYCCFLLADGLTPGPTMKSAFRFLWRPSRIAICFCTLRRTDDGTETITWFDHD